MVLSEGQMSDHHGPKHEPGVTSNEGQSKPGIGKRESVGLFAALAA
jgi:hypothetical protein